MAKHLLKGLLLLMGAAYGTAVYADDETTDDSTTEESTDEATYVAYSINADDNTKQDLTYTFNDVSNYASAGLSVGTDVVAKYSNGSSFGDIYACTTTGLSQLAFSNASSSTSSAPSAGVWWWRMDTSNSSNCGIQLRGGNSSDYGGKKSGFAILDLKAGDVVTINGAGFYPNSTQLFYFYGASSVDGVDQTPSQYSDESNSLQEATYSVEGVTNGSTITINVEKDGYVPAYVGGYMYMYIRSIVITRDVETDNFTGLQTYTLKYVDSSGNTLKTATCYATSDETTATATDTEMEPFTVGDITYAYVSGNETITLSTDAENVITLIFTSDYYHFDIDAMAGDTKLADLVDEYSSTDTITVSGISEVIEVDGVFYQLSDNDVSSYQTKITASSTGEVSGTVDYKINENMVFFKDDSGTASNVASGGSYSGMYSTDATMASTTLDAGYYNVVVKTHKIRKSSYMNYYVNVAGTNEATVKPTGNTESSTSITVAANETAVKIVAAYNSDYYDYYYIEKITDQTVDVTIKSVGIASFSAPYTVSVPDGVNVYQASLDDEQTTLTLTKVETDFIPANTGVILQGDAGTYTFSQTDAQTSDAFADNVLQPTSGVATQSVTLTASTSAESTDDDGNTVTTTTTYYVLTTNSDGEAVFGYINSSRTLENKAYLTLTSTTTSTSTDEESSSAKAISIVFASTTGIETIDADKTGANGEGGALYNLQGLKVENPQKGLYIQNGKKVIVH